MEATKSPVKAKAIDHIIGSYKALTNYFDSKNVVVSAEDGIQTADVHADGIKLERKLALNENNVDTFIWASEHAEVEEVCRVLNAVQFSAISRVAATKTPYNEAGETVFTIFATVDGVQRFLNQNRPKGKDDAGNEIKGWTAGKEMQPR